MVHTGGPHIVHDFDHPPELGSGVGLEKDPFVGAVRQFILDFLRQFVRIDGIGAEEHVVIAMMSEVTLAASFRFANAMEFCLLRVCVP